MDKFRDLCKKQLIRNHYTHLLFRLASCLILGEIGVMLWRIVGDLSTKIIECALKNIFRVCGAPLQVMVARNHKIRLASPIG